MNGARFPGAGSALLVLIFTILCLTVSALMSLSLTGGDRALSEKVGAVVQTYYSADCRAVETAAALRNAIQSGEVPEEIGGISVTAEENEVFSFSVPAGEGRVITVRLAEEESGLEILSWQETYTEEWTPDKTLTVYTGEDVP